MTLLIQIMKEFINMDHIYYIAIKILKHLNSLLDSQIGLIMNIK